MNPIYQGLSQGYTPQQILKYLSKAFPAMATPIAKATGSGYNAKQILGFLSKNFETEDRRGKSESQIHGINRRADAERTKYGLTMAGSALAIPFAARAAQSALSNALPSSLQHGANQAHGTTNVTNAGAGSGGTHTLGTQPVPNQAPNPVQNANPSLQPPVVNQPGNLTGQQTPNPAQLPNQPVNTPNIPQTPSIQQPKVNATNATKVLSNSKSKDEIDGLIKQGYNPKQISAYFQKFHSSEIKKIEKEAGDTFEKVAEQYIAENEQSQNLLKPDELVEEPIKPAESIKKEAIATSIQTNEKPHEIKKSSIVTSPQGVGEVKEIRNGQAIVEIDGKLHKVKEDELEPSSFTEDEIADAYDNLMAKIPEQHRSGYISWAGYDEDKNKIGYTPRGGKYEEISDITPEEAQKIKEGKGVARTTGENREGLWIEGEDTRGGVISQIVHDRRKAREKQEEKQLKLGFELPKPEKQDRGMKPIFDEMAYARGLSQAREKRIALEKRAKAKEEKELAKQEEKERKKKERDEAKKRKKQT